MPTSAIHFAILAALIQFSPLSYANWTPGKAAQVNFFTDVLCLQYNGEVPAWWTMTPFIGNPGAQADCISLDVMPSSSKTIATVNVWEPNTASANMSVWPPDAAGSCTFWDESGCSGNSASSDHTSGSGGCQPTSSKDGSLSLTKALAEFSGFFFQSAESTSLLSAESNFPTLSASTSLSLPTKAQFSGASTSLLPTEADSSTSSSRTSLSSLSPLHISINPSSTTPDSTPSLISANSSAPTQSAVQAAGKTFFVQKIAGVAAATVFSLGLIAAAILCLRRARKKRETHAAILPTSFLLPDGQHTPLEKSGAITIPSRHNQGAGRNNNGAHGDGSSSLEQAMLQNNILEARVSALERELRLQPSDFSPPEYVN
ncbi:hypothetical protein GGX14DRAFT_578126 [Mycena pura]|uniref:Uncharacterized protein n=1 Tax=Mycena pura TaxID=153505 RepID=A0AAD6Y3B5_9AGAR|nr:hypothetical protein GGX14DRAFT_578126 [Mycena pura]